MIVVARRRCVRVPHRTGVRQINEHPAIGIVECQLSIATEAERFNRDNRTTSNVQLKRKKVYCVNCTMVSALLSMSFFREILIN